MPVRGDRIAARLKLLTESQSSLARAIGMRQQGIQMIIAGQVDRPKMLREIARFLKTTEAYLLGETNDASLPIGDPEDITRVPLISWVSAGKLSDPGEAVPREDAPLLAFADLGPGDFFCLTVTGDSMDRLSPEGSRIVINRADQQLVSGKPYVFSVRGEATYKLWNPEPYLEPFSTNPTNKPVFVKRKRDLHVVGRVRRTALDL